MGQSRKSGNVAPAPAVAADAPYPAATVSNADQIARMQTPKSEAPPPAPVDMRGLASPATSHSPTRWGRMGLESTQGVPLAAPKVVDSNAPPAPTGPKTKTETNGLERSVKTTESTTEEVDDVPVTTTKSSKTSTQVDNGYERTTDTSELTQAEPGQNFTRNGTESSVKHGITGDGVLSGSESHTDWTDNKGAITEGGAGYNVGTGELTGNLTEGTSQVTQTAPARDESVRHLGGNSSTNTVTTSKTGVEGGVTDHSARVKLTESASRTTSISDADKKEAEKRTRSANVSFGIGISGRIEQRADKFYLVAHIDGSFGFKGDATKEAKRDVGDEFDDIARRSSATDPAQGDAGAIPKLSAGAALEVGATFEAEHQLTDAEIGQIPLLRIRERGKLTEGELTAAAHGIIGASWLTTLMSNSGAQMLLPSGVAEMTDGDGFSYSIQVTGSANATAGAVGARASGKRSATITGRRRGDTFDVSLATTETKSGGGMLSPIAGFNSSVDLSAGSGDTLRWALPIGDKASEAALASLRGVVESRSLETLAEDPVLKPFLVSRTLSSDEGLAASGSLGDSVKGTLALTDNSHLETTTTRTSVAATGSREVGVSGNIVGVTQATTEKSAFTGTSTGAGTTGVVSSTTTVDKFGGDGGRGGRTPKEQLQTVLFDKTTTLRQMKISADDFRRLMTLAEDKHDWVDACVTASVLMPWLGVRARIVTGFIDPKLSIPGGVDPAEASAMVSIAEFTAQTGANGRDCMERALGRGKFGTSLEEWPPELRPLQATFDKLFTDADLLVEDSEVLTGALGITVDDISHWCSQHDAIYAAIYGATFSDSRAKASMLERLCTTKTRVDSIKVQRSWAESADAAHSQDERQTLGAVLPLEDLLASFQAIEHDLCQQADAILAECDMCMVTKMDRIYGVAPLLSELTDLHARWRAKGHQLLNEYDKANVDQRDWRVMMMPAMGHYPLDPDEKRVSALRVRYDGLAK